MSALRAAVAELAQTGVRCSLVENATPRAFYNGQQGMGQADFVLKLDDSRYDIGFYKNAEGFYEARTDFWGGDIERCIGAKASSDATRDQARMGRLFQLYGVHAATEAARKQGHMVRRIQKADGKIALEVTGPNL